MNRSAQTGLAVGLMVVSTAGVVGTMVGPAQAQGPCGYVTNDAAQVRENPSLNSVNRKTKPRGSYVTGPCTTAFDNDGRPWVAVDCDCASDGIGWIVSSKLD